LVFPPAASVKTMLYVLNVDERNYAHRIEHETAMNMLVISQNWSRFIELSEEGPANVFGSWSSRTDSTG